MKLTDDDIDFYNRIRLQIKNRRTKIGMTQKELADLVGTSEKMIYDYEAGKKTPGTIRLKNIYKALGLPYIPISDDTGIYNIPWDIEEKIKKVFLYSMK